MNNTDLSIRLLSWGRYHRTELSESCP